MPAPSPSGSIALALSYAASTLALSANFQAAVGVGDPTDALARIFIGETDEHADGDVQPRALIDVAPAGGATSQKVSDSGWLDGGVVEVVFELPVPTGYQGEANYRAARLWFYNAMGGIKDDLKLLFGQAGNLNVIQQTEVTTGRADPDENDGQEFFVSVWNWTWLG